MTPPASAAPATIGLSLVSHTNVGKTTLARTLLGRDIGEVRDEAHVTQEAEGHAMAESPEGDRLELWDTPGFGDSVRLARRLEQAGNPIGWFLAEVWDRFRHRPFWSAQRAMRNVLERADVVLYLVNASESPADAGYLDAELKVLQLLGKPVVVLLNQLGPPQPRAQEEAQRSAWQQRVGRPVLPLDAFARCWVQEGALLDAVAAALPEGRRAAFERLRRAWEARSCGVWQASMDELAHRLAQAATDREPLPAAGWGGRLKSLGSAVGRSLGLAADTQDGPQQQAMSALAQRAADALRQSTDRLIALHGLDGRATDTVLARVAEQFALRGPVDEGRAALWGGAVTGALAGLKADLLSGGLTLGGGMLAGGLIGALGAAGLARGFNLMRGVDSASLAWSEPALDELAHGALLGYLTVAHYGRGRGDWQATEHPVFWNDRVAEVVARHREALHAAWARRDEPASALQPALRQWLLTASQDLLASLYPQHAALLR
ncbi:GTPase [Aquincola sp. MAHUQ-54]|uniref:GTPase n=1 Tax=Aquincola agrisoli TaxID=3119538 RepID=A0AAW9QPK0_9BURK